ASQSPLPVTVPGSPMSGTGAGVQGLPSGEVPVWTGPVTFHDVSPVSSSRIVGPTVTVRATTPPGVGAMPTTTPAPPRTSASSAFHERPSGDVHIGVWTTHAPVA